MKNTAKKEKYDHNSYQNGLSRGKSQTMELFANKFEGLSKVKGIGKKTMDKLQKHFGNDFFLKQLQRVDNPTQHRQAGDTYKPLVKVQKSKKGVPTVIWVDGVRYILDSESARKVFK